ncbi:hypothetical protein HOC13_04090 [Candidatus Woesearchaeota archaeon]|jgi:hypothetical protein|nr:hypothetical protein [Candidatus Woesearchaeota archaeon]
MDSNIGSKILTYCGGLALITSIGVSLGSIYKMNNIQENGPAHMELAQSSQELSKLERDILDCLTLETSLSSNCTDQTTNYATKKIKYDTLHASPEHQQELADIESYRDLSKNSSYLAPLGILMVLAGMTLRKKK